MNIIAKIGITAGALFAAQSASATVTITSAGLDSIGYRADTIHYSPTGFAEYAGIGRIKLIGTDNSTLQPVTFNSWCVDIFDWLTTGTFTRFSPSTLPVNAVKLSQLGALLGNAESMVTNADTSAAVQLAVWEIMFEAGNSNYNVDSGDLFVTGGNSANARTLANGYLASVTSGTWQAKSAVALNVLYSARNQTQLYTSAVPEPASWLMMIGGFGLVGSALRRRPHARLAAI